MFLGFSPCIKERFQKKYKQFAIDKIAEVAEKNILYYNLLTAIELQCVIGRSYLLKYYKHAFRSFRYLTGPVEVKLLQPASASPILLLDWRGDHLRNFGRI